MADTLSAVIFGATGAVGNEVLKELVKSPKFSKIVVINRRHVAEFEDRKIVQIVVDYDKLQNNKADIEGVNIAFCCLGTTRNKSGAEGFVKVDRDYVYEAAKICHEAQVSHFHLVSSGKASSQSSFLYMKTKGEAEEMVVSLGFPRVSIYRPALLLCDREESRPLEKLGQITMTYLMRIIYKIMLIIVLDQRMNLTEQFHALVVGATGAIGKEVVKELVKNPQFSKVTIIARRKLDEFNDEKIAQKIVDFDKLEEYKNDFEGAKVAYCCLGTTRSKAGAAGFVKVDKDYVYQSAQLCRQANCQHFHLVTSMGSDSKSSTLYLKTKGETEGLVKELDFPRCSIYRPGLLLAKREETRLFEGITQCLAKVLDWGQRLSIPVQSVAKAMINNTITDSGKNFECLEHRDIRHLSGKSSV